MPLEQCQAYELSSLLFRFGLNQAERQRHARLNELIEQRHGRWLRQRPGAANRFRRPHGG